MAFEFTNPVVHVGWLDGSPAYIAFSTEMAQTAFEEFSRAVVICVVPPYAGVAKTYEEAINFFCGEKVAVVAKGFVFAD